jgi:hypothetical protein
MSVTSSLYLDEPVPHPAMQRYPSSQEGQEDRFHLVQNVPEEVGCLHVLPILLRPEAPSR